MEATVSMEVAKHTLISGGVILAIGTFTALLAQKIKIPDIPAFLLVGIRARVPELTTTGLSLVRIGGLL